MDHEEPVGPDDELSFIGGSENPDIADAMDLAHLVQCYGRVKPYLVHWVFRPEAGWKYAVNRNSVAVFISLWEGGQVGFTFGIVDNAASSPFIALYCMDSLEERVLEAILRGNERAIRCHLGRASCWENDNPYPIGEYVRTDKPEATASRLAIYRDLFTAYLDRVMPRRHEALS